MTDQTSAPTGPPVRVALVGAGATGHRHAEVLGGFGVQVELVAVVNRGRDRADDLTRQYGGAWFPSLGQALARATCGLVVICTSTGPT